MSQTENQGTLNESRARMQDFLNPSRRKPLYLERITLLRMLLQLKDQVIPGDILDVGCGIKPYQSILETRETSVYWGVDYPVTMTGSYAESTRTDVHADCLKLPFNTNQFDNVINTQVLEHVPDPSQLISEMSRVLKPGGILIITAPMTWPLHEEPYDFYRYTQHGMKHLLEASGLNILVTTGRGYAASTLGQLLLDVLFDRPENRSLLWKICSNVTSLAVNISCEGLDKLIPASRLRLGWGMAAVKKR